MSIGVNIYRAESISLVNRVGQSGSKWVEITIRDSLDELHEIRIIPSNSEHNMAMFFGVREGD